MQNQTRVGAFFVRSSDPSADFAYKIGEEDKSFWYLFG
jgi:hypothetical protein